MPNNERLAYFNDFIQRPWKVGRKSETMVVAQLEFTNKKL